MSNPTPDDKAHSPTFHAHWAHQLRGKNQGLNPQLVTLSYATVEHTTTGVWIELLTCTVCHYVEARCTHNKVEWLDEYGEKASLGEAKKKVCLFCRLDVSDADVA
jgi:hypothetical protein